MKHLKAIGTVTILAAVAAADSTISNGRPDLQGLWLAHHPNDPKIIISYYTTSQSGNRLTMAYLPPGKPDIVMFEGAFESNAVIVGKAQGDNLRWTAAKIGVPDVNHLKLENGPTLIRATGSEAAIFKQIRRFSFTKIPEKPFNLTGIWSLVNNRKAWIKQDGDQFRMGMDGSPTPFFRGRYVSNPVIKGEALEQEANNPKWTEKSITVQDPDHLKPEGVTLFRISKPASQDLPCDAQNTSHVKDYYAFVRGSMAASQKDFKAARCWLNTAAEWDFPAAQSMLAALIVKGTYGTPDYPLAFSLVTKSAEQGDIAGEVQLASMYREGKGTQPDPQKAGYWLRRADQTRSNAQWKMLTTKTAWGLSPLEVAGLALEFFNAVDADMSGGGGPCFAEQFRRRCQ